MTPPRGFSTLEMLIAMTVLILTLSAVTLLLPGVQASAVDTQESGEGLALAQQALEMQQQYARKDFRLVVATSSDLTLGGITYHTVVTPTTIDFFTKKVTAAVSWGAMYGRPQNITLSTIVSNFPDVLGGDTCDALLAGNWASPTVVHKLLGQDILGDSTNTYPITSLDAFQKRLYVSVNAGATPTALGPNNPQTNANNSAVGNVAWSSSANAQLSDNAYSTATLNGGQSTNYLKATNLGFSIPANATIVGVVVEVERKGSSSSNTVRDSVVKLVRADGTVGATNKADTSTNWPTGDAYKTYGANNDLWSETGLSPAAINNANFGVVIAAAAGSGSGSRTASIDHIRVTVYYTRQFYVLSLANPSNPSFVASLPSNSVSTGINAVAIATSSAYGSYAYLAPNSTTAHVQVLDISATPTVLSTYQIPSANVIPNTLFFRDGYLYVGLANNSGGAEFFVIDVHNPLSIPATPLGSYEIGAGINSIYVKSSYAYITTDDTNRELVILNLNDLAHPALFATYNAAGAAPGQGKAAFTVGDTVYLGRYYTSNAPELMVINASTTAPLLVGSSDIGTTANAVGIYDMLTRGALSFLLTGNSVNGLGKLQIVNTQNPASITAGATVTLPSSGQPAGLDCEGNYLYAASVPLTGGSANKGTVSIITAP